MPELSSIEIDVSFNNQQIAFIDTFVKKNHAHFLEGDGCPEAWQALLAHALTGDVLPISAPTFRDPKPTETSSDDAVRTLVAEHVIQPGHGKAIEVPVGHILRIEQLVGAQCVDFNCFNLHDYKERLHVGRTRSIHGFHPTRGHFLWSSVPRERPMLYFLTDTANCHDTLYPYCSAGLYRNFFGIEKHTNCHEIQAEAQREYGLTPDDVHESFNLFMPTDIDTNGNPYIKRGTAVAGDHVEFYALFDVLAVPNVCGDDLAHYNNFSLKPVKASVLAPGGAEAAHLRSLEGEARTYSSPHLVGQPLKSDRALSKDPDYQPGFPHAHHGDLHPQPDAVRPIPAPTAGHLRQRPQCRPAVLPHGLDLPAPVLVTTPP
ncbi:DUF1989 domain-containing protein [Streptomyces noursei]|uniref:DUF1989 domain-containing protein n=1 Tax=Streptomyces noursei TaxID=1971 RepID=UPI0035DDC114